MLLKSMDYLCCPLCNAKLKLIPQKITETELVQGMLECVKCARHFEVRDGLPNLIYPEKLEGYDLQKKRYSAEEAERYDRANRKWLLRIGILEFGLWENRARKKVIDRLELKKHSSVLETGVGTATNLQIIANNYGERVDLHGMDISFEMLNFARRKLKAKAIEVEFVQANATYLPYLTANFDAVLHMGAMNQLGDKKRAIEEMYRVVKPGGKVVICDEGLAPGKEKTWLGNRALKHNPALFKNKPPSEFIPDGIKDLKIHWVWQGTFWIIEFRRQ